MNRTVYNAQPSLGNGSVMYVSSGVSIPNAGLALCYGYNTGSAVGENYTFGYAFYYTGSSVNNYQQFYSNGLQFGIASNSLYLKNTSGGTLSVAAVLLFLY